MNRRPRVPPIRTLARRLRTSAAWVFTAVALAALPASAQENIASDRPGIGSAAVVVAPGVLQAEFGTAWFGGPGADALGVGQLFVRYGLGALELEFLGNSWVTVRDGGPDGFEDVGVGAKVRVAQGISDRADLSFQGLLTAPTGGDAFTADEWVPTVVALMDVSLGATSGMGVNFGYRFGPGDLDGLVFTSVTPAISLTDQLGAYGGWAGNFFEGGDTHWIEGGLAYLVTSDLQLDLNGAASPDTDRWFIGVGMAVRTGAR